MRRASNMTPNKKPRTWRPKEAGVRGGGAGRATGYIEPFSDNRSLAMHAAGGVTRQQARLRA
jgi:hypothetical protein